MIFIEKIQNIGEKRILTIPNMYKIAESVVNIIDGGGASVDEYTKTINGGYADTKFDLDLDGGFALFSDEVVTDIRLVHTISRKMFAQILRPTKIDDNYFTIEVVFNEIPPEGQYLISVFDNENNKIYSDLLQIGKTSANNKEYNKEIKIKIYEK